MLVRVRPAVVADRAVQGRGAARAQEATQVRSLGVIL